MCCSAPGKCRHVSSFQIQHTYMVKRARRCEGAGDSLPSGLPKLTRTTYMENSLEKCVYILENVKCNIFMEASVGQAVQLEKVWKGTRARRVL